MLKHIKAVANRWGVEEKIDLQVRATQTWVKSGELLEAKKGSYRNISFTKKNDVLVWETTSFTRHFKPGDHILFLFCAGEYIFFLKGKTTCNTRYIRKKQQAV